MESPRTCIHAPIALIAPQPVLDATDASKPPEEHEVTPHPAGRCGGEPALPARHHAAMRLSHAHARTATTHTYAFPRAYSIPAFQYGGVHFICPLSPWYSRFVPLLKPRLYRLVARVRSRVLCFAPAPFLACSRHGRLITFAHYLPPLPATAVLAVLPYLLCSQIRCTRKRRNRNKRTCKTLQKVSKSALDFARGWSHEQEGAVRVERRAL
jgi:hypothetical protein